MPRTTLQIVPDEQREKDQEWNRYILYQFEFEVKHKKNIKAVTRMVLDMTRGRITKFLPNYAFLTRRLEEMYTLQHNSEFYKNLADRVRECLMLEELKQDEFFEEMILLHYVSKLLALFEPRTTIGDALVTFPDFDWLPIKREFNLQDDTYEATFRSSVRAMHIAIAESVTINNILFILNPALVLAYRNVVKTKFPKLVGMLHKQFPKTILERVSTMHYFLS